MLNLPQENMSSEPQAGKTLDGMDEHEEPVSHIPTPHRKRASVGESVPGGSKPCAMRAMLRNCKHLALKVTGSETECSDHNVVPMDDGISLEEKLVEAVRSGSLQKIKEMPDEACKVVLNESKNYPLGHNPLRVAVAGGRMEIVTALLDLGADPNIADSAGFTPLQVAVGYRYQSVAQLLLERGARVTEAAVRVSMFVGENMSDADAQYPAKGRMIKLLHDFSGNTEGRTAVHLAAYNGEVAILENFLKSGVCANLTDKRGQTPLYFAVTSYSVKKTMIELLFRHRADINIAGRDGKTPLFHALEQSQTAYETCIEHLAPRAKEISGLGIQMHCSDDESSDTRATEVALACHVASKYCEEFLVVSTSEAKVAAGTIRMWLLEALKLAHMHSVVKRALRLLLATRNFSSNVEELGIFSSLKSDIAAHLTSLGVSLEEQFEKNSLGYLLMDEVVHKAISQNPDWKACSEAGTVSQTQVLPASADYFAFDDPLGGGEKVYLHVLQLVSSAIDEAFNDFVRSLVCAYTRASVHHAAPKSFVRSANKMYSRVDYRHKSKPRCAFNADVCRLLVEVPSTEALLAVSHTIANGFGGYAQIQKIKNLFSSDEKERAERYHLLCVMLTVPFSLPGGTTYADLRDSGRLKIAFEKHVAIPEGEPEERWRAHAQRAYDYLQSDYLATQQVSLLCEVQVMLSSYFHVRQQMHESYRVVRAVSGAQMWADFARSVARAQGDEKAETTFHRACRAGQLAVAKTLLVEKANIDDILSFDGQEKTPLALSAEMGHPEVVHWLLNQGADVNLCSPLFLASQFGHVEVARLLVENKADPDCDTCSPDTPLYKASEQGYLDVVELLLDNGAYVDAESFGLALQNEFVEIVEALLVNVCAHEKDFLLSTTVVESMPAVQVACNTGNAAVIKVLQMHGASLASYDIDGTSWNPLHDACTRGMREVAAILLDLGADKNLCFNGVSPMYQAAISGHCEIVELLVSRGAQMVFGEEHVDPLKRATLDDRCDVMRALLACEHEKISKDYQDSDGQSLLFLAVSKGSLDMVQLLLEKGADVEGADLNQRTPLHEAAHKGHCEMVRLLLDNGSAKEATDNRNRTPLHTAVSQSGCEVVTLRPEENASSCIPSSSEGHLAVIQLLLDRGANSEASDQDGKTALHIAVTGGESKWHLETVALLIQYQANMEATAKDNCTPLHLAVSSGFLRMVKLLLQKGANVEAAVEYGETSLHLAIESECLHIVEFLLEKSVNTEATGKDNYTPLHTAVRKMDWDSVPLLLEKGASAAATTKNGETPLHLAVMMGSLGLVEILVNAGARIGAITQDGATPLHLGVMLDCPKILEFLLDKGANIEATTKKMETPLHLGAQHGFLDSVEILLHRGADLSSTDMNMDTPLHLAAKFGYLRMVNRLLRAGADGKCVNNGGDTPISLAVKEKRQCIVDVLKTVVK